jgi:hypothetical protein
MTTEDLELGPMQGGAWTSGRMERKATGLAPGFEKASWLELWPWCARRSNGAAAGAAALQQAEA